MPKDKKRKDNTTGDDGFSEDVKKAADGFKDGAKKAKDKVEQEWEDLGRPIPSTISPAGRWTRSRG